MSEISMPCIRLECIDNGQQFYWSDGKLYTEDEYLNGWEPVRMYTCRDPRHGDRFLAQAAPRDQELLERAAKLLAYAMYTAKHPTWTASAELEWNRQKQVWLTDYARGGSAGNQGKASENG